MDSNWPRWIFASISKHFETNLSSLKMFIEGEDRDTWENKDFIELRIDGPYYHQISKNLWRAKVEVNILLQVVITDDLHLIHRRVGEVSTAFTPIIIYKYGDGVGDDDSQIGCFQLIQNVRANELLIISHFGRIKPELPLLQASVEGHFEVDF
jgi:hypothetical protein